MPTPDLTIGGIALVPIVVALVKLATAMGLSKDYAPLLTGGLTVVAYILLRLVEFGYLPESGMVLVLEPLVLFLMQTGFYAFFQFNYERFVEGKRDPR